MFHAARNGLGRAVTITVSSMSETTPNRMAGSTMNTGAVTAAVSSAAMVDSCQPGSRSASSRRSMMPSRSALSVRVTPPAVTVIGSSTTGMLKKLRHPRTLAARCTGPASGRPSTTRQSTRTHPVDPYPV